MLQSVFSHKPKPLYSKFSLGLVKIIDSICFVMPAGPHHKNGRLVRLVVPEVFGAE